MKKIVLLLTAALGLFFLKNARSTAENHPENEENPEPNDWFWAQRAFPVGRVPSEVFYQAVEQTARRAADRSGILDWELAGPTNVGGRITDLAMHPSDLQTIYAASASGGVWKSDDAGATWRPISDQLPSLSVGDIALDPSDKNTIYCGTGEPNGGGGSLTYDGRGIFKSTDGGKNWTSLGLEKVGCIGRVEVDPQNPKRIFVAAMGNLFGNNPERGVFRTTDGGLSWQKVLFVNDSTGAVDLVFHPKNPDTIFAATWQRIRRPDRRDYGGPGSALWRSTDGGTNWEKLKTGLPTTDAGRIGLDISPSQPNILYTIFSKRNGSFEGVFKSQNGGDSWTKLPGGNPNYSSFGWWFGKLTIHPTDPNQVFTFGVDWEKTQNGGQSWSEAYPNYLHADYHALVIHPANPNFRVVGNDGGVFVSTDGGAFFEHRPFAITQFYTSEIDFQNPTNFYGGAQDNGTWRTRTGADDDWEFINGGDGFVTLVNPNENWITYSESQYGNMNGSNGAQNPQNADRFNWNAPYIFDPNDPNVMYFGGEKLFKSLDGGLNWFEISDDLTGGPTGMGGVTYGTITTIATSPLDPDVLWVGTDDGNVWTTDNGGSTWRKVNAGLPRRWVTRVVAHPTDKKSALVCLSGFRHFDGQPHIFLTENAGQTWTSVSGDLPDVPVNDLVLDPANPAEAWFIATDAGVFATTNAGQNWQPASEGLPQVPIMDLTLHAPTRTLAAATYGRSMFRATLPPPVAVNDPQPVENLRVAPNPFAGFADVSFFNPKKQRLRIELFDASGCRARTVFSGEADAGPLAFQLDGGALRAGVFLLKIENEAGEKVVRRVVRVR